MRRTLRLETSCLKSQWKRSTSKLKEFNFRKVSAVLKPLYVFLIAWGSRRLCSFLFLLTPLAQRGNFTDVQVEMESWVSNDQNCQDFIVVGKSYLYVLTSSSFISLVDSQDGRSSPAIFFSLK